MDCNTSHRPPSLLYKQGASARVYALHMHFSLVNTSKMAVDDAYSNPSIASCDITLKEDMGKH